jgi:hypothetical protein
MLVPAAFAVLLIAGCGGETKSSLQATPPAPTSAKKADAKGYVDAPQDVKITKCVKTSWTQNVTIEVTNSTSEAAKYVVGVAIKDSGGRAKSEARFVQNRIEPGKTVTQEIPGDTPIDSDITCAVGEAKHKSAE